MIKKILLLLGIIVLLNLSFVSAYNPIVHLFIEPQDSNNLLLIATASDEDHNTNVEWIKIYENGVLIPTNTYICNGINPLLCEVLDYTPVSSIVSYQATAKFLGKNIEVPSNTIDLSLAPIITNVNVPPVDITTSSVVVTWDTDELSDSRVRYGLTSGNYDNDVYDASDNTFHTITVSGLTQDVTYFYVVESEDVDGNTAVSNEYVFTPTDINAPIITNINVPIITPSFVDVEWTTNEDSDSRVRYGLTSGSYTDESYDPFISTFHSVTITGLTESQTYYYVVESEDVDGDVSVSAEGSFVPRNVNAPVITNVNANLNTVAVPLEVTITWTTNEDSDSTVLYGTSTGTYTGTVVDPTVGLSHSITIYGLSDSQTYYYVVESMDLDVPSNTARSLEYTFGVPDVTEPVISGLNENEITLTTAKISWNTDEPATSRISYGIVSGTYTNQVDQDVTLETTHEVLLEDLSDGATYYYIVENEDAAGNVAVSTERSFTTGRLVITFSEPDEDEEFNLGDTIEGEVRVENADLSAVEIDINIVFYDDSENDEIETVEFDDKDIDALDHRDFSFEFDLPYTLDEGNNYQIIAEVTVAGQKYEQTVDIDIDRDDHLVVLENVRTYVLGDNVEVSVDVENIGRKDEEDVYIELRVYGIGVNLVSENFDLGAWDESENSKTKVFRFDKPSEGVYTLEATVYYGSSNDYVTEDFQVKSESSSQKYDATLFEGNIQGVSSLNAQDVEESNFELLTMENVTWGIVDFLLLSVVIYGFVWLIRKV